MSFNKLTSSEAERLTLLMEECGEVIQAIGKIFRHGYESYHPDHHCTYTNRKDLEKECGHVRHSIIRLCEAGDLEKKSIHDEAEKKSISVVKYLHHQNDLLCNPDGLEVLCKKCHKEGEPCQS